MNVTRDFDPEFDPPPPKPEPRRAFRPIVLLLVPAFLLLLIALFLPAVRSAGPAARRSQCTNNLKQIALALRNYEDVHGALPPAHTVDASGRPLHSWRVLILPFLEQEALYRSIDLSKPWNDPANASAYNATPSVYWCPEMDDHTNKTAYLAVVGRGSFFLPDHPRRRSEIPNGNPEALTIIEAPPRSAVHWMEPTDADELLVFGIGPAIRLNHGYGTNSAYVDGSVRFIKASVSAAELGEMFAASRGGPKPNARPHPPDQAGNAD